MDKDLYEISNMYLKLYMKYHNEYLKLKEQAIEIKAVDYSKAKIKTYTIAKLDDRVISYIELEYILRKNIVNQVLKKLEIENPDEFFKSFEKNYRYKNILEIHKRKAEKHKVIKAIATMLFGDLVKIKIGDTNET